MYMSVLTEATMWFGPAATMASGGSPSPTGPGNTIPTEVKPELVCWGLAELIPEFDCFTARLSSFARVFALANFQYQLGNAACGLSDGKISTVVNGPLHCSETIGTATVFVIPTISASATTLQPISRRMQSQRLLRRCRGSSMLR